LILLFIKTQNTQDTRILHTLYMIGKKDKETSNEPTTPQPRAHEQYYNFSAIDKHSKPSAPQLHQIREDV